MGDGGVVGDGGLYLYAWAMAFCVRMCGRWCVAVYRLQKCAWAMVGDGGRWWAMVGDGG